MSDVIVITEESALVVETVAPSVLEVPAEAETLAEVTVVAEVLSEIGLSEVLESPPEVSVLVELVVGPQGPPGPAGAAAASEDDMRYSKQVDFVTDDLFYKGEALPGTAVAAPSWRISRTTVSNDGDVAEEWAEGSSEFSHIWDNRASYTYH
jgi:hypothetical protein